MKLLIIGAGGHGKCCYDIAQRMGNFSQIDFVDDNAEIVFGKKVVGKSDDLHMLKKDYDSAFVAIGNNEIRYNITQKLIEIGYSIPILSDPSSVISSFSEIGKGTVVFPNSVVEATAIIGEGCISKKSF